MLSAVPSFASLSVLESFTRIMKMDRVRFVIGLLLLTLLIVSTSPIAVAQTPVTNGYKDFSFGTTGTSAPTGEKPESKLWYTPDGIWWGNLYNNSAQAYRIYRFAPSSQSWTDTGVAIDDRNSTKSDALWDSATNKLYVASHTFTTGGKSTSASSWGRVYRYTYNQTSKTYTLDSGFPVNVTRGKSETLTLAKDSTGMLWVTYVEGGRVYVNHSTTSDTTWGTPYIFPGDTTSTTVSTDDISDTIAFGGNKIAVMWSNQKTSLFYFAIHNDGDSDTTWTTEIPITGPTGLADDHLNMKTTADGRVFVAVKTSFNTSTDPLIKLLVRSSGGSWSDYTFGRKSDHHTRPIVLLDEQAKVIHMFATSGESGGVIYYKSTDLDNPSFSVGLGTPFIRSIGENDINDATSTKQNVTSSTGLLVAAGNDTNHTYYHNNIGLGAPSGSPTITSFSPTSGGIGTSVTVNGTNFTGATAVAFNGATASFHLDSDTSLTASVPTGATTGPVSVTNGSGTGTSTGSFTVSTTPPAPTVTSFSPTSGAVGTSVTVTGTDFTGATAVAFNGTTATFNVVSDTSLTASVPTGATTGPVSVTTGSGTGTSSGSFTVSTTPPAPTITSFSPSSGAVGTSVTVTGTNFTGATAVAFNGQSASFNVVSDTSITTTVPSGATSGPITVSNGTDTSTSSQNFVVTTTVPAPTISSFSPTSGPVGTSVTISGANFTGATAVNFNGVTASFSVTNDSTITATVPSTTTGQISVTTPQGTGTSAANFTVTTSTGGGQTFTLNPTADTYVRGGAYADMNFATATNLVVRTTTPLDGYRDSYLKYDLGSVSNITSAKLRFMSRLGAAGSVPTEVRAVADSSWTETGMTYNNRPALGNILGSITVSGTTFLWYEVDVTSYVQAEQAAGRTLLTFGLHDTTDSGTYQSVYSKEYSLTNAAKLVVVGSN